MAASQRPLSQPWLDGGDLYWVEGRPGEGGRQAIVRRVGSGQIEDVTPPGFNARSMVHEYGGGDYAVAGGTVWCARFEDQRLYRLDPGSKRPRPLTPEGKLRYADLEVDGLRDRIICVREDHTESDQDCVNELVAVPSDGGSQPAVLARGRDFYSSPRLSPDGLQLAWLEWDHPLMPWDGAELQVAAVGPSGELLDARRVAGGPAEAIFQPAWSPGGVLHFVSDRSGWWNLYRDAPGSPEPLAPMEADFGVPQWRFDSGTYDFLAEERIVAAYWSAGFGHLAVVANGRASNLDLPHTAFSRPVAAGERFYVLAASPATLPELLEVDLARGGTETIRTAGPGPLDPRYVAEPEAVEFSGGEGIAHGLLYRPRNPDHEADGPPPLLIDVHGGPTAAFEPTLSLETLYFTSRGFAVLELNYRGSSGYGRAYRDQLYGAWGVADVEDAVAAARGLVTRGDADPLRLAVRGGSAGGYTTLAALAFAPGTFTAGVDLYGLSDLRVFDRDTHKFECRYITRLIGGPEHYEERSPMTKVDNIDVPLLVLQGLDDHIVPPNQADIIIESLAARGVPHAYIGFEGEGHGFRRAESIIRSLESELAFYAEVYGLDPADPLPDLELQPKLAP